MENGDHLLADGVPHHQRGLAKELQRGEVDGKVGDVLWRCGQEEEELKGWLAAMEKCDRGIIAHMHKDIPLFLLATYLLLYGL